MVYTERMRTPSPNREAILAETTTKRQHYVPRFVLSAFGDNDQIERFDLDTGAVIKTSTTNVAVEAGFYDVEIGGRRLSAETWLSDSVEGPVVDIVRRLAVDPCQLVSLNRLEQWVLARFMAAQRFRVPSLRLMLDQRFAEVGSRIAADLSGVLRRAVTVDDLSGLVENWEALTSDTSRMSLDLLAEAKGFANLLLVREWRIGRAIGQFRIYTSDNAVTAYLRAVRPWWSGGSFAEHEYIFPLSPTVILWVAGEDYKGEVDLSSVPPFGARTFRDYNDWEVSFARHAITAESTKYIFGAGPYVDRECASRCIRRFEQMSFDLAVRYQGYDPRQPRIPEIEEFLAT